MVRGDSLPLISHSPWLGARAPRPDSHEILGNSPSTDHKYPISHVNFTKWLVKVNFTIRVYSCKLEFLWKSFTQNHCPCERLSQSLKDLHSVLWWCMVLRQTQEETIHTVEYYLSYTSSALSLLDYLRIQDLQRYMILVEQTSVVSFAFVHQKTFIE